MQYICKKNIYKLFVDFLKQKTAPLSAAQIIFQINCISDPRQRLLRIQNTSSKLYRSDRNVSEKVVVKLYVNGNVKAFWHDYRAFKTSLQRHFKDKKQRHHYCTPLIFSIVFWFHFIILPRKYRQPLWLFYWIFWWIPLYILSI